MEKFVDRIIETDRKAREIIEAAHNEKEVYQKEASERARRDLAERAAAQESQIAILDKELAEQVEKACNEADNAYITAKHILDSRFDAGREGWLHDIVDACLR